MHTRWQILAGRHKLCECVCNRERWGGDKQCVCCKRVWGVTMCISALVCDSSSVFESVPAGPPSGLRQAQPTESLLIKTVLLSSRRWVYIQARAHMREAGTSSTSCIITRFSRFHEDTQQGFINQHTLTQTLLQLFTFIPLMNNNIVLAYTKTRHDQDRVQTAQCKWL